MNIDGNSMTMPQALCAAQGGKCFYCGRGFTGKRTGKPHLKRATQWTRDHLIPRSELDRNTNNIVLACDDCNQAKGSRHATPDELMRARTVHAIAVSLMNAFNGAHPHPWSKEPAPEHQVSVSP